jgi:hypothetical protein
VKAIEELCEYLAWIICEVSMMKSAVFMKEEEHADKWSGSHKTNWQAACYYIDSPNINLLMG